MRTGDTVVHGPTNETWTVAYADEQTGELVPCGWPLTFAKLADCTLVEACTNEQSEKLLVDLRNMSDQSDPRCRWARRNTQPASVAATLSRITFASSCVALNWQWEVDALAGTPGGCLIRASFQRPDRDSGNVARGYGRWWHVPADATESAIVKAAYAAARMVLEHELMEAFHYGGARIFDPHHDVADLLEAVRHASHEDRR